MVEKNKSLTVPGALVIIACVAIALIFLWYRSGADPDMGRDAARVRCASNLRQLATAVHMYVLRYGGNSMYPIPAQSFRGDVWLATLYWTGLIDEPGVFLCPGTDDLGSLPPERPRNLASADAVDWDAVSYAGLCSGLAGRYSHRNTREFGLGAISASVSAMACDDDEGSRNHRRGLNVVYFDCHVEFLGPGGAVTYDSVGARWSMIESLDSGED